MTLGILGLVVGDAGDAVGDGPLHPPDAAGPGPGRGRALPRCSDLSGLVVEQLALPRDVPHLQ